MIFVVVPLLLIAFWALYFMMPPPHGLPILAYHRLSEWTNGKLTITVDKLDEQLGTLKRQGYQSVTFSDLKNLETTGRPLPIRPILITFDDDYLTIHRHVYPILKKYGLRATVFLPHDSAGNFSQLVGGRERVLGHEGIKEMCDQGIDFALRSQKLDIHQVGSLAQMESDISNCIAALERTECPFVRVFAYPYGFKPTRNGQIFRAEALQKFRIDYAVRVGSGLNHFPFNKQYNLVRITVDGTDSPRQFKQKVMRGKNAWV